MIYKSRFATSTTVGFLNNSEEGKKLWEREEGQVSEAFVAG